MIDKPAGVAVHGGSGVSFGVIEALRAARPKEDLELVHRLDRDTSGCLLVARKRARCARCTRCMREGQVEKRYLALVKGNGTSATRSASMCRCAPISAWAASAR